MSRKKKYDDAKVIEWMDEYWAARLDGKAPPKATFKAFSAYLLEVKGVSISDNLLRHTPAVSEHFYSLKSRPAGKEDGKEDELREERYKKLESLLRDYLLPELFNHVLKTHQKLDLPDSHLQPEMADKAVITPKSQVFDHEVARALADFFEAR